jgi:hypothetical protein
MTKTSTETKETTMARPRKGDFNLTPVAKNKKYTADNPLPPELRITPAKVVCGVCSREQWADENGRRLPHLTPAEPGDPGYTPELVTMRPCEGSRADDTDVTVPENAQEPGDEKSAVAPAGRAEGAS